MRFKIRSFDGQTKHEQMCTSIACCSLTELTSIGDDNIVYKWDINNSSSIQKWLELDCYATDHDWLPHNKSSSSQLLAIGFIDGSLKLFNKNGKLQKKISDAHQRSVICLKWSYDGGALATGGEQGMLKIWSKNGDLRTNLIQDIYPIYSLCWNQQNDSILYCYDKFISLKLISSSQQKQLKWKAHQGLVLKIDWNASNNCIVSASQDCRYKVWDSYGRLLYSSSPYDYVITSISWSSNGDYFSVGSFGMFKLCDRTGWTYSFHKTEVGSINKIIWTADGTLSIGSCGNGNVLFAELVDKHITYSNWQANLNDQNKIIVTDILSEMNQFLQFKDRVINMSIGYNDLIVTTANQCYIYNFTNWNTPNIIDLKDSITFILQSLKYFCLIQATNGLMIYNYQGKLISNPKITGTKFQFFSKKKVSLSLDILAVIETYNPKIVKFYEIVSGKPQNYQIEHSLIIQEIHLNQTEATVQRKLAFIDINYDLYLTTVHRNEKYFKLSTICDSFIWQDKFDILASITDSKLKIFFYPNVVFIDPDLLEMTSNTKQVSQLGRLPQILNYSSSQVTIRRKDGGVISVGNSPYPMILFQFCEKSKWDKAIKLCRFVKQPLLWACLSAISLKVTQLDTAQTALAAIQQPQKVSYINEFRQNSSQVSKNASIALLFHKQQQAEQIYIHNKLYFHAIQLHLNSYRWQKAFKLSKQLKIHLDIVVAYRNRYLKRIGKAESNKQWAKYAQEIGDIDWENINSQIEKQRNKTKK